MVDCHVHTHMSVTVALPKASAHPLHVRLACSTSQLCKCRLMWRSSSGGSDCRPVSVNTRMRKRQLSGCCDTTHSILRYGITRSTPPPSATEQLRPMLRGPLGVHTCLSACAHTGCAQARSLAYHYFGCILVRVCLYVRNTHTLIPKGRAQSSILKYGKNSAYSCGRCRCPRGAGAGSCAHRRCSAHPQLPCTLTPSDRQLSAQQCPGGCKAALH